MLLYYLARKLLEIFMLLHWCLLVNSWSREKWFREVNNYRVVASQPFSCWLHEFVHQIILYSLEIIDPLIHDFTALNPWLGLFTFICRGTSTRRERRNFFGLRVNCYYQSNHSKVETIPLSAFSKDTTSELTGFSSYYLFKAERQPGKYQHLKYFGLTGQGNRTQVLYWLRGGRSNY